MKSKTAHLREKILDFDLNIVPIIDCMTILITFMLAAGVYISIGVLDVGVSSPGGGVVTTHPDISITIRLNPNRNIQLDVSGKESRQNTIAEARGNWNFLTLAEQLTALKQSWPAVSSVTLISSPDIPYQDVVKAMEIAKGSHTEVLLGGF